MSDEYEIFDTDIAIVGMAARLPGARTVDEYWQNLVDGVESVRSYTNEELLAAGETPENLRRKNYVPSSAPLADMEMFDGEFFGFSPKECAIMDPQHRQFLETCWEALEHAGHTPERFEGPIGVFAGCGMGSYFYFNLCSHPELVRDVGLFLLRHTGNDKDFLATRASYLLNLQGPSIGVQTACSTSLVAAHMAVQSLVSQECDMALAGGVTIDLPHRHGYLYHEGEVLSPDGHCHAFDAEGQGTVFGSGAGIVALRRLEDALDDGDVIHAVIRGSAVNNDGSSKVNYLAPSVDGQASCMVEAYGVCDVDPRTIGYIECHGTGTYLGDPIEIEALTQAFRTATQDEGFCRIGSVKTNIGHLDTAAGVASLVKTTLALKHATIPKSLNFETPNPNIDFESSPFRVATEKVAWPAPAEHPRRAAVNALGVGGTNAHMILQEPPAPPEPAPHGRPAQLLTLSARTRSSLDGASAKLAAHLRANPDVSLADVAWTLRHGRRDFKKRRVVAATTALEAAELLELADAHRVHSHNVAEQPSIVFLLSGGGTQYPRMAKDLYAREPVFKKHVDLGLKLVRDKHDIDLEPLLFPKGDGDDDAFAVMEKQLPAIFITSVAMARLFESWGVKPDALLGHSLGENTAAHLAGVMSFEDCLGLTVLRGRLFSASPKGAMLSIALPAATVQQTLPDTLDLAVINGPEACVVSGAPADIDAFEATFADMDEVDVRRLAIPAPAHSRLLDGVLEEFGAYLRSIKLSKPKLPFPSNTTGTWITDEEATSPDYWVRHLRSTVRFSDNVTTLFAGEQRLMVEVGPGRTLSSLSRQNPDFMSGGHSAFPSIRHRAHEVDDVTFFTTCLGRIWASGGDFDWDALWPGEERSRVELPTYAWDHKHYFIERGKVSIEDDSVDLPKIEDVEDWGSVPLWKPALPEPTADGDKHTWLIFMDPGGIGTRLAHRLVAKGDRVVSVFEGDAYACRGGDEYSLSPERGREGYSSLVADLIKEGKTPDRVVHLWLLDANETFRPGSSLFHHHQERGFFSLFFLAQAFADESVPTPLHITTITNGMQRVEDEPLPYPQKATVLGPVKVLPRELEGATASVVDVVLPKRNTRLFGGTLRMALVDPFSGKKRVEAELGHLTDRLEDELRSVPTNSVVALRGDRRFEQFYAPTKLAAHEGKPTVLRDGGTYLITGGLGGLGLTMAEYLAKTCSAKLVLLGRSPLPPRDQWADWLRQHGAADRISRRLQRLLDVEAAGGEVLVVSADVTNVEEMREALAAAHARFGKVHGVVHTAGVVDDGLMALKSLASVESVFTPKIQGTRVLAELFADDPLDLLVLFSSTSTASAPAGQVDYVAANAFLDAFAEGQAGGATRTISLHWGLWNEVGMAAETMTTDHAAHIGELVGEQPEHPLLDARVRDAAGDSVLRGVLSTDTHWVLDGHRTKAGHSLVPGTGYLELAHAALRANGELGAFEIEDLFFLRPFAVDDGVPRELRVKLRPTQRGYSFEVLGRVQLDGRVGWVKNAQAHLALAGLSRPSPIPVAAIEARCDARVRPEDAAGMQTPQEVHLDFGPRWRALNRAAFGAGEGFARLSLPEAFASEADDFGLHPALLDIATGWAMDLIEGYEGEALWVPVSYERVRVHGALPAKIVSWVHLAGAATAKDEFAFFDVVLADEEGRVLVEVDRLGLRRMAGADFSASKRPAPRDVDFEPSAGDHDPSPAELQLALNIERGIVPAEGQDALGRVLAGPDRAQVFVSSLELAGLVRQADRGAGAAPESDGIKLARPDLEGEYVEPRNEVERTLVSFWQDLLGVELVGVEDSFFDLGGHSLIAVRLFAKIKRAYRIEFPISVLFEAPTIERCAALIRETIGDTDDPSSAGDGDASAPEAPRTRYTHLVSMHDGDGGPKTPFFLVAGMFGNVLNLRHLAHLVGTDRRFYGLQARGLYGDQEPHETFEEMASAYLAELETVQPRGPYFLGGFSGGGVTAFEMAQQLRAKGEEVALLVMLDTPVPEPPADLGMRDRALIQRQQLRDKGAAYLGEWAINRWNWELSKLRKRFDDAEPERSADEFHDEDIEMAFRRALGRYELKHWPGTVSLYRPKLPVAFDLGGGRRINDQRDYLHEDNGWTPHVGHVDISEVPGDHDSMVLEPNVRVLARRLRKVIEAAEAKMRARPADAASAPAE